MNQHFVSVGPKLAERIKTTPNDNPLKHIKPNDSATLILKPVTNSQVLKGLKQLTNGKACGPDKIPTTLVKDAANFISYPLTLIYNSSIKNGIFPDLWKIAKVAAIFKSGKRCDSNNYRPISVLSIFSRVLEKIVHDQLHEFLKVNGILTNNQYAFRKLYSTIMSLINSTEQRKCECQIFDRQNLSCEILRNHEKVDRIMHLVAKLSDFCLFHPGFFSFFYNRFYLSSHLCEADSLSTSEALIGILAILNVYGSVTKRLRSSSASCECSPQCLPQKAY